MAKHHRSKKYASQMRPKLRRPTSTKPRSALVRQIEPEVLNQRSLRQISLPPVVPKSYPFRKAFEAACQALLHGCPRRGVSLTKLEQLGDKHWQRAFLRFLEFLVELGHVVIDKVRQRVKPIVEKFSAAGPAFYHEIMPTFAGAH